MMLQTCCSQLYFDGNSKTRSNAVKNENSPNVVYWPNIKTNMQISTKPVRSQSWLLILCNPTCKKVDHITCLENGQAPNEGSHGSLIAVAPQGKEIPNNPW